MVTTNEGQSWLADFEVPVDRIRSLFTRLTPSPVPGSRDASPQVPGGDPSPTALPSDRSKAALLGDRLLGAPGEGIRGKLPGP